jgi:hypothetical protein
MYQLADASTELAKCVEGGGFDKHFDDLVELFCGGTAMDAGAPGG